MKHPSTDGLKGSRIKTAMVSLLAVGFLFALCLPSAVQSEEERGTGLGASHIMIDPQNPNTIYLASTLYGVYKSTDRGESWRRKGKGFGAPDFYALAVHPKNSRIVLVGAAGGGIYRSTDGGESWMAANDGLTDTSVYEIVFDARHPNILYALTLRELFKSTDQGQSWSRLFQEERFIADSTYHRRLLVYPSDVPLFFVANSSWGLVRGEEDPRWRFLDETARDTQFTAFAYHPDTDTLYAGARSGEGLWVSRDGGVTWERTGGGLDRVWVNRIVLDPKDPEVIYLATRNKGVLKSVNAGRSWEPINHGLREIDIKALAIDPRDPRRLYLGTYGDGIFISDDAGLQWRHRPVPPFPTWKELNASLSRNVEAKGTPPPPPEAFLKCQGCHSWTDPILNGPTKNIFWRTFPSRRDWRETMQRMQQPAQQTSAEAQITLNYLNRYYGVE